MTNIKRVSNHRLQLIYILISNTNHKAYIQKQKEQQQTNTKHIHTHACDHPCSQSNRSHTEFGSKLMTIRTVKIQHSCPDFIILFFRSRHRQPKLKLYLRHMTAIWLHLLHTRLKVTEKKHQCYQVTQK